MVNSAPCDREIEAGLALTGEKLADSEVTDGSVTTDMFPNSTHTYWYPQFAQRIIGASSPASMEAWRRRAVVLWPSWQWHGQASAATASTNLSEALRHG